MTRRSCLNSGARSRSLRTTAGSPKKRWRSFIRNIASPAMAATVLSARSGCCVSYIAFGRPARRRPLVTVHTKNGTWRSSAMSKRPFSSRSSSEVSTATNGYRDWIVSSRSRRRAMARE
jgi:hypothetical protein